MIAGARLQFPKTIMSHCGDRSKILELAPQKVAILG